MDAAGEPIPYGRRWGVESAPEERYSMTEHPERFVPLHRVADALIRHLIDTFAVTVVQDRALAEGWWPASEVVRAVRLIPVGGDTSAMTFIYTNHPGLVVQVGLLHRFVFPICGCDACDETWQSTADRVEDVVLSVVAGLFTETARLGFPSNAGYSLTFVDGSGVSSSTEEADDDQASMILALTAVGPWSKTWAAWSVHESQR